MIIVSDTSPLCNLALVDFLWILQPIYQTVIIPQVVADELQQARSPKIQAILTLEWIEIRNVTNTSLAEALEIDRHLDPGESNAIALAVELKADELLIDERLGRQTAAICPKNGSSDRSLNTPGRNRNPDSQLKPHHFGNGF